MSSNGKSATRLLAWRCCRDDFVEDVCLYCDSFRKFRVLRRRRVRPCKPTDEFSEVLVLLISEPGLPVRVRHG